MINHYGVQGVRVYDVVAETTISLVPKPLNAPTHLEVPWRISWGDQFKLLIAFGTMVKVDVFKNQSIKHLKMCTHE